MGAVNGLSTDWHRAILDGGRCLLQANVKCSQIYIFFYFPGFKASIRNETNVTHAPFSPLIFWHSLSVYQKENKDESVFTVLRKLPLGILLSKTKPDFCSTKNVT